MFNRIRTLNRNLRVYYIDGRAQSRKAKQYDLPFLRSSSTFNRDFLENFRPGHLIGRAPK